MTVEVALSPAEFGKYDLKGKTAVIIDVLRFTTTLLAALEAGMSEFYPVRTVEEALDLKKQDPSLILQGEREFMAVPGFDYGNSPLCHVGKRYSGERLVCTTTNGTNAILAAREAEQVVLTSIRSAKAAASYLMEQGDDLDLIIFPAGLHGRFSLEDTWCAGQLLSHLPVTEWGDGAKAAKILFERMPIEELRNGEDATILKKLNSEQDLDYCLAPDTSTGVIIWDAQAGWGRLLD